MSKISLKEWKEMISDNVSPIRAVITDRFSGKTIEIEVTPILNLKDEVSLIRTVRNTCFDEEGNYIPHLMKATFGVCLVSYFTNISTGKNSNDTYDLVMRTDVIDVIERIAGKSYLNSLYADCEDCVQEEKRKMSGDYKAAKLYDELLQLATSMEQIADRLGDSITSGKIDKIANYVSEYIDAGQNELQLK